MFINAKHDFFKGSSPGTIIIFAISLYNTLQLSLSFFTHAAVQCELLMKVVCAHRSRKKKETKTTLLNRHSEAKAVGSQANYMFLPGMFLHEFHYLEIF